MKRLLLSALGLFFISGLQAIDGKKVNVYNKGTKSIT